MAGWMRGCGAHRCSFSDQAVAGKLEQLTQMLFCMGAQVAVYYSENDTLFIYLTKLRLVGLFGFIGRMM